MYVCVLKCVAKENSVFLQPSEKKLLRFLSKYFNLYFFFSPQAMWLCKHFNAIRVSQETLLFKEALRQTEEAKAYKERNQVCKRI